MPFLCVLCFFCSVKGKHQQHTAQHSTVHYNSCFICSVMGRVLLRTQFIPHGHKRYYVVHVYVYVCARHMCVVTICCVRLSFVPFTQYLSRVSNQLQQLRDTHTRKQTLSHTFAHIHAKFISFSCASLLLRFFIRFHTQHFTLNSFRMNRWARETKQYRSETVSCAHTSWRANVR